MKTKNVRGFLVLTIGLLAMGLSGCGESKAESQVEKLFDAFEEGDYESVGKIIDQEDRTTVQAEICEDICDELGYDLSDDAFNSFVLGRSYPYLFSNQANRMASADYFMNSEGEEVGNIDEYWCDALESYADDGLKIKADYLSEYTEDEAVLYRRNGFKDEEVSPSEIIGDDASKITYVEMNIFWRWGKQEYGTDKESEIRFYDDAVYVSIVYLKDGEWHVTLPNIYLSVKGK